MPARIAFCITTLEPGGAERQLVELVTRLPRERFEPAVVVLSHSPQPPSDELLRKLSAHSISVEFLGGRSLWQAPHVYRRLANWLRTARPELLQCFLAHANVLGAAAARRRGISIVAGIRVAEQRRNGHRLAQRLTSSWVDRYVCVSQDVAKFALDNMRLPSEKLVVIPNGVDVKRFSDATPLPLEELGISRGRKILLFIGRLEADKRPAWLIERMPAIAARLPDHDLVIAGHGPLEVRLRRQAAALGLENRIHFVGWRSDTPRLLAAADMLVLNSSSEGMPNVVLEAMAAAKPVLATAVHGVDELLDEDSLQIVAADDPDAFVEAAARLASDRELAKEVGERNRQRARATFSLAAAAVKYVALYDSLLAERAAKKSSKSR